MNISAALVKELRERTGSGMMECKKALVEMAGDIEAAVEHMRKTGLAKADKKADRIAAEGRIVTAVSADNKQAVIIEVNCETDFVSKGDDFADFAQSVADVALSQSITTADALLAANLAGETVDEARRGLISKVGENINVRRNDVISGSVVGAYLHGVKIGVIVELEGGDTDLAKDLAMHIAASKPLALSETALDSNLVAKEREIAEAKAAESGKPADIVSKMVDGAIKKYIAEVTLLGQAFIKNPDQSVDALLKANNASVKRYIRYELGDGIEKKVDNFVEEVMAQARA